MQNSPFFDRQAFESKLSLYFNQCLPGESTLKKAMGYSLLSPGKRIRPQLVYETAAQFGLSSALTEPVAFALEMVHAFSLIHDDLPCMDDDDLRRGLPTNHKVFGEPMALLAGDALLSHALETFGLLVGRINPLLYQRAFQLFTRALGGHGLMGGQAQELEPISTLDTLLKIQKMKTTALFEVAFLVPLILVGFPPEDEIFQNYLLLSQAFGFAFQAADDLEDRVQDFSAQFGSTKNLLSFMPAAELKSTAQKRLADCAVLERSPTALELARRIAAL